MYPAHSQTQQTICGANERINDCCPATLCHTTTASSPLCGWDFRSPSSIPWSVVASRIFGVTTSSFADSLPYGSPPGIGSPNSAKTALWILRAAARKLPRVIEGMLRGLGCACALWRSRWNRHMRMTDKLCSMSLMTVMKPD